MGAAGPDVVRAGWRSKHAVGDTEITAEFLIESSGKATVCRAWAADAELTGSTAWLQRAGEKRAAVSALGWDTDLKESRPFLSHAELEAFFGKPSELHDLLASVLGLEDLASADKRLNAARKAREDELSSARSRRSCLDPRGTARGGPVAHQPPGRVDGGSCGRERLPSSPGRRSRTRLTLAGRRPRRPLRY